jgi:signal transduction histidine kinase
MTFGPRSLAFRVVSFSTVWAVIALIVIATVISSLYRQASERGFENLLAAHLFNLISSVGASKDGVLQGRPDLGDLRFNIPRSGWYWSVEPISNELGGAIHSQSMTQAIPSAPVSAVPFNVEFRRTYTMEGLAGERLQVMESEFVLGEETQVARFRMMGNLSELEQEIASFNRQLYTYLVIFGAGMIAINMFAILFGLQPLARVREALSRVREGAAQRLDGKFPVEIEPLASETNALIENNRRIVERARTQVGNLAHSLKTPLAVLVNEGRAIGGGKGRLIVEQAEAMRQQVEHYLQRARIAAQRDSIVFRTPVKAVLERMARVMAKLKPETPISLKLPSETVVFAGEREDFEEIVGNLFENALKWATTRVVVTLSAADDGAPGMLALVIEDDGPGIPEERAREALKRGRRLDETKPGTGLGLSIVADLVAEYGGSLQLERSQLGGLRAVVHLRQVE